jgi:serine/threonine-protein kinase
MGEPSRPSLHDGGSARQADEAATLAPPADRSAPRQPYLTGDVIDEKYRLTRIIGRGGMGAVWQAHNLPLDIDVAIKLIRRDRTTAGAEGRLLTEARAAARLMHPAIVRVFDFGETSQGDPFIVMELLHGESLSAILRRKKRLSPAVAVQTLLPVAAALASAHGKGIVHRDLKPDNIIVASDEGGALVPKIVDFGIAKLLSPDVNRAVTLAGEVLGSPDYMSPEQARGAADVGEATDIWAFSVMLYELMTGKRPFDGPNYNALIASILTDDAAPLTAHGACDAVLSGIVARGLARETTARWPRMRDMGAALASWAVASGVEDDLMGSPIAKQWLSGGMRRLLTVQPETGEPRLPSGPVAQPSPWATSPPPRLTMPDAREVGGGARRASAERARRALLVVVAVVLLGAASVAAFLVHDRLAQHDDAPAASVASPPTRPDPSSPLAQPAVGAGHEAVPSASAAATGTGATAEPPASAAPSATSRLGPLRLPRKGKGPSVQQKIRF